jgi:ATP-dependent Lon protease
MNFNRLFIRLKVWLVEKYQRQKIKKRALQKHEDRIFKEELKKIKLESKTKKDDDIRERAKTAAKMTSKGIPESLAKGLSSGFSELKKGKESIERVQKDLQRQNVGNTKKSKNAFSGRGLDDLISITPSKKRQKRKEEYPWSLK